MLGYLSAGIASLLISQATLEQRPRQFYVALRNTQGKMTPAAQQKGVECAKSSMKNYAKRPVPLGSNGGLGPNGLKMNNIDARIFSVAVQQCLRKANMAHILAEVAVVPNR